MQTSVLLLLYSVIHFSIRVYSPLSVLPIQYVLSIFHLFLLLQSSRDASSNLPVLQGPIGGLTHGGPVSFKYTAMAPHPVESIQNAHFKNERDGALFIAERVYGVHTVFADRADRQLLARKQPRVPGAELRGLGPLETYLGRDDKIDIEDVFGQPELKPRMERLSAAQLNDRIASTDR